MKGLSSPDPVVRADSAWYLGRYYFKGTIQYEKGVPATEEVVKLLIRNLNDENQDARLKAVEALTNIGGPKAKSAVPALIEQIKKGHQFRGSLLLALSYIGSEAKEAIPIILECTKDKDDATREYAVAALANVDANTERTIRILGEALNDESSRVRQRATRELGYQTPIPEPIIRALERAAHDNDEYVAKTAKQALESIRKNK